MGRFGSSFRAKLLRSVFLTVALPAFALMVVFYVGWNGYVRLRMARDIADATEAIAKGMAADLAAYDKLLEALAADPEVVAALRAGRARQAGAPAGLPPRAMAAIYAALEGRGIPAVVSGNAADGRLVFGTMGRPGSDDSDLDWGIFGLMRREPGRIVAYQRDVGWGASRRTDWALGLAVPDGSGGIAGFLLVDLAFRDSDALSASRASGVTGRFILVNEFDRVVAAYDGSSFGPFTRFAIEGPKGEATVEGTRYAFSRTEVGLHGLAVYGLASIEFIASSFRFGLWTVAVIIVLSSAVFVLVLMRSVSRMMGPMDDILATMAKVSQGDFGARLDVISGDEFEELATRLNALIGAMGDTVSRQLEGVELAKAAEMKQLEAQFNPHFLYNTIDTAKWMIRMGETEKAQAMLTNMAKVLRYSVQDRPAGTLTSLREDLAVIRTYVEIHRLSLGDRLEVSWDIDDEVLGCRVPKLLIQPLVENAVTHGVADAGGGRLGISARREGGELVIRVEDSGKGFDADLEELGRRASAPAREGRAQLGLALALRRARLQYGERFSFDVSSQAGQGTAVTLRLPLGAGEEPCTGS